MREVIIINGAGVTPIIRECKCVTLNGGKLIITDKFGQQYEHPIEDYSCVYTKSGEHYSPIKNSEYPIFNGHMQFNMCIPTKEVVAMWEGSW